MSRPCRLLLILALFLPSAVACGDDAGSTAPGDVTPDASEDVADSEQDVATVDDTGGPVGDTAEASEGEPRADLAWDVGQDGPFGCGYRTFDVTYSPDGYEGERTITVSLWYPTEDTAGEAVAYQGFFTDEDVFVDAALAPPVEGSYPLHLHSHGHTGFAGSSPWVMRYFATHGWVVAAPDHTGNTISDNIDPRPPWMYFVRGADLSATLDALAELPATDELAGIVDTDRVIASGHSFGGYTVLGTGGATFDVASIQTACDGGAGPIDSGPCSAAEIDAFEAGTRDSRVVGIFPMAGGNHAMYGQGVSDVGVPVLQLSGDADTSVTNASESDPIWELLPPGSVRVDAAGGCHQLFGLGGCDALSDDVGLPLVNTYALAFSRFHLLGDTAMAGILDGTVAVSDAATFSSK